MEKLHHQIRLRILSCSRMSENHREPEVLEAEAQVGKWLDCRARITSKELAQLHSVKNGTLQNACSTSPRVVADLGKSALIRIARLMNSLAKRSKNGDKSATAMLKISRQLGCVFQDMEPPKSSSILRKSSDIRKPIRCVQFTKAVVRLADIRDQNPSLGMICPGEPHQRNPNAPKFENRSQDETEWQERCACEAAWRLAKSILKITGEKKSSILLTFGKLVPVCIISCQTRGTRICCGLRRVDAHDQQKKT